MKIRDILLLSSAAAIVPASAAAARWELESRSTRQARAVLTGNSSSTPVSSSRSESPPGTPTPIQTEGAVLHPNSSTRKLLNTPSDTPRVFKINDVSSNVNVTLSTPTPRSPSSTSNLTPSRHLRLLHLSSVLASPDLPSATPSPSIRTSHIHGAHQPSNSSRTADGHGHHPSGQPPAPAPSETGPCTPLAFGAVYISFVVVHTDTVTFYGNRSHYTPPYPTPFIPNYCSPTPEPEAPTTSENDGLFAPSIDIGSIVGGLTRRPPLIQLTFVTTDKNPAVVFPTEKPPHYSFSDDPGPDGTVVTNHKTALLPSKTGGGKSNQVTKLPGTMPKPTFIVTAGESLVVINHRTFSNLQPKQTQTVTAGDSAFTIFPDAVVGQGQTVSKPIPTGTQAVALTPTGAIIEGMSVGVSGSSAVVDGTSFGIPTVGTSAVVGGKSVSIGPGALVVGGSTLNFNIATPMQTNKLVAGGELVTAVGGSVVVVHSTTITYGPGILPTRELVGNDFVSIGPSGITVDGMTFGGQELAPSVTSYVVVGGATVTESGASVVIIDGSTYTVGPGATSMSTVIDGQTITLGPRGVSFSTITFSYPFGPMTTSTITGTYAEDHVPVETEYSEEDEDSIGVTVRARHFLALSVSCIAIGVLIF